MAWLSVVGFAFSASALLVGCGADHAGIGHACTDNGDCAANLQCLREACTPLCHANVECGDGYLCDPDGLCSDVISEIGQACSRELDCGPGQTCRLDDEPGEGGVRAATCQPDHTGEITGSTCTVEDECRNSLCSLGRCTELCTTDSDCPGDMACVTTPGPAEGSALTFKGCLQKAGTLELTMAVDSPHQELLVPVPESALSFALVARVADHHQLVGASKVTSPSGKRLYVTPSEPLDIYQNDLRHQPAYSISTLLIPNTPRIQLETGFYAIEISSFLEVDGVTGTAIPQVTVIYKLSPATTLDLHLRFLNLEEHPCIEASGLEVHDAASAESSSEFRLSFVAELRKIFERAGIELGNVTYGDILQRGDLDGLELEDLPTLLRLSDQPSGITIFFVRSITPVGIQAIAGGNPGPPGMAETPASGVAVSFDTLCYRGWREVARATAHEIGRYMGLFRNREPDGASDPIPDSDSDTENLMFYGEFGGTDLSEGQSEVLQLNPGLQ